MRIKFDSLLVPASLMALLHCRALLHSCLCYGFPFHICLIPEGVMFNSIQFCTVHFFLWDDFNL